MIAVPARIESSRRDVLSCRAGENGSPAILTGLQGKEIPMNRSIRVPAVVLAGLLVAGVAGLGCQTDKSNSSSSMSKSSSGQSLYQRLGGEPAIRAVVDD